MPSGGWQALSYLSNALNQRRCDRRRSVLLHWGTLMALQLRRTRRKLLIFAAGFLLLWIGVYVSLFFTGAYSVSRGLVESASRETGVGDIWLVLINPFASEISVSGASGRAELSLWVFGRSASSRAHVYLDKKHGVWCAHEASIGTRKIEVKCDRAGS